MGLVAWVRRLESRYPWGFIGFSTGIIGLVIGLYVGLHERKPALVFDIVSEANVLDVHTALPDLTILFRGEDIQKTNLNLRILRIRVSNNGEADIPQGSYDVNELWGFRVRQGKAIEARLVEASSDYLNKWLRPQLLDDSTVKFEKVILEKEATFTVELLVLHPKDQPPQIGPVGKVAGVERIDLVRSEASGREPSFSKQLVAGGIWIHLARFAGYVLSAIAVIALIAWIGDLLAKRRLKRQQSVRREEMRKILAQAGIQATRAAQVVIDLYAIAGVRGLEATAHLTRSAARLARAVRRIAPRLTLDEDWLALLADAFRFEGVMVAPAGAADAEQYAVTFRTSLSRGSSSREAIVTMLILENFVRLSKDDEVILHPEFLAAFNAATVGMGNRVGQQAAVVHQAIDKRGTDRAREHE